MKFSFVPQTFFRIFFFQGQDQDHKQDQDMTMKFIGESYSLHAKDIHGFGVAPQSFCEKHNSVQNQDHSLWISIPDLRCIHRRHPLNFDWIR